MIPDVKETFFGYGVNSPLPSFKMGFLGTNTKFEKPL